ncbi:MAG: NDP-sugar synthase [Nocardioides sp.]|nr:NDP-sugar synthase [Nocardioides sp.]
MRALVLCGGKGLRLSPFSNYLGKPLIPVLNRPLVGYTLGRLARAGITDVAINHMGDDADLRAALGDGSAFGVKITYLREHFQHGTGGALHLLGDLWNDHTSLVVTVADMVSTIDLPAMVSFHQAHGETVTFGAYRHNWAIEEWEGDVLLTAPEDQSSVEEFQFRPGPLTTSRVVTTGTWVLERRVLEAVPRPGPDFAHADNVDLNRDVFRHLTIHGHRMRAFVSDHRFFDFGDPISFVQGSVAALHGEFGSMRASEDAAQPERIHASARISPTAFVDEDTVVGADVVVGDRAQVRGCVLLPGARVPEGAVISAAVMADETLTRDATRRMYADRSAVALDTVPAPGS